MNRRYAMHVVNFNKWGGLLIIIAALFPLPWGVTCSVAGLMKYPRKKFLLYALTRIVRFYIYASALYHIV
jgi:membrane protein YqaA with SNARE-associated domain